MPCNCISMSTYFVNTGCQKEFALCFISISITLTFEFRWFPAKKSGAMLLWSPVLQFYFYMSCYVHISLLGGYSSLVSEASSWLCKSIMTCQLFQFSWIKFEQRRHALSCQYPGRESKDDLPGHWSQVTEKGHNLVTDYYSPLREQGTKNELLFIGKSVGLCFQVLSKPHDYQFTRIILFQGQNESLSTFYFKFCLIL